MEDDSKRCFGIKVSRMREGDYSLGACITCDGFYGEYYIYMNIVKWTVTIGYLLR